MNARTLLTSTVLIGSLLACGGGGGSTDNQPKTATSLTYTDPTTGTYQLRKNTSLSTATHLVLELWGPATTSGCGVSLTLTLSGTGAAWQKVQATDAAGVYAANGTAFNLGSGTPILKSKVTGGTLVATVAEKGTATPKTLDKALIRVAMDLQAGTTQGAQVLLTPDAATCQVLLADGTLAPVTVAVSGITAQ